MKNFKQSFVLTHSLADKSLANFLHLVFKHGNALFTKEALLKAYSPITNAVKLSNGMTPHLGLISNAKNAAYRLQSLKSTYQTAREIEFKTVLKELTSLKPSFEDELYAGIDFVLKNFK